MAGPLYIIEGHTATKTQLVSIEVNRYSVPPAFARRKVGYRRYESFIEILDGNKIADRIELAAGWGKQVISDRHYPQHARLRPQASHPLQAKFEALAPSAKSYLQGLSRSRVGHLRERMERTVALANTYSHDEIKAAMPRSCEF